MAYRHDALPNFKAMERDGCRRAPIAVKSLGQHGRYLGAGADHQSTGNNEVSCWCAGIATSVSGRADDEQGDIDVEIGAGSKLVHLAAESIRH